MKKRLKFSVVGLAVVALVGLFAGDAFSATTPKPSVGLTSDGTLHQCVLTKAPYNITANVKGAATNTCPSGYTQLHYLLGAGAKGATGATGAKGATGPQGPAGVAGKDGTDAPTPVLTTIDSLSDSVVLTHVGGTIKTGATVLTHEKTLSAGTYRYDFYADFSRAPGAPSTAPQTFGTAFLWADTDGDNDYDWQAGESLGRTVQTGNPPITPTGSIEQSATGTGYFTLTEDTKVQLGGFAYNSDTSNFGTGTDDFSFLGATVTFEFIPK